MYGPRYSYYPPEIHNTADLLMKQTKGEFLTPAEKERLQRYASNQRLVNRHKKKN